MSRSFARLLALPTSLLLSGLMGCATTSTQQAPPQAAYRGSLSVFPSGLRLLVHEAPEAAEVSLSVSYRVGASDEPEGKGGLAFLAATTTLSAFDSGPQPSTLIDRLEAEGARVVLTVDHDLSSFNLTLPAEKLPRMLKLEAQRMRDPLANLTEEHFLKLRAVVVKQMRQYHETDPEGFRLRWMQEKLLPGHPYGRCAKGSSESLENLTFEDVRAFVKKHYTPAHAVVAVAGPRPVADVKFEVDTAFLALKGTQGTQPIAPVQRQPLPVLEDSSPGGKMLVLPGPVQQPRLLLVWTLPGTSSGKTAQAELAVVLLDSFLKSQFENFDGVRRTRVIGYELDGMSLLTAELELHREEDAPKVLSRMYNLLKMMLLQPDVIREVMPVLTSMSQRVLLQEAKQFPVLAAIRTLRATGRADYLNMRKQLLASISANALTDYMRDYVHADRMRVMLVKPR